MDISAPKLNSTFKTTVVQKDGTESEELMKEISQLKSLLRNVKVESENSEIPLPEPVQELKQLLIKQGIHKEIIVEVIKMSLEQWYSSGGTVDQGGCISMGARIFNETNFSFAFWRNYIHS